jgi:oligopeptide transport system substrate-binding protein
MAVMALMLSAWLLPGCVKAAGSQVTVPVATKPTRIGGNLEIVIGQPDGIDPGNAHEPNSQLVVSAMCDQLIMLDPISGTPRPAIAERWTVTENGKRLFIKLRKGVLFQNGRELVADDIAYTLSRVASLEYASEAAGLLSSIDGFAFIHGDLPTDDDQLRERLSGVKIVDDHSVEIDLSKPFADFYRVLAHPAMSPVPHEEVEKDPHAFESKPVCVGPYRLSEKFNGTGSIKLARNGSYYARNTAFTSGGAGYVSNVVFDVVAEGGPVPAEASIAQKPDVIPGSYAARGSTTQTEFLGFPTSLPPFDDPLVRRAISLALDRDAIASKVFASGRSAAGSFVPSSVQPKSSKSCDQNIGASARTEQAKAALAKSGQTLAGVKVKIYFNDEFNNRALITEIANQLTSVFGIVPELVGSGWEDFLARGTKSTGFDGLFRFGWSPSYPSADANLFPLFHTDSIGRDNLSRFSSRDFDEAMLTARKDADDNYRAHDYVRAEEIACLQMPMTPLVSDSRTFYMSPSIDFARGEALGSFSALPVIREAFTK